MEIRRLRSADSSWDNFKADWSTQCQIVGDNFQSYGAAPISMIRECAEKDSETEWAIGLYDKKQKQFFAAACAILATQKPYIGKVLRIREVVVCPLLDYGELSETQYGETLIDLLFGAVKLSESELVAKHIKMHLRSPADSRFFAAVGKSLDSKGVFAATEAHGAWLSFTKKSAAALKAV
jgi:hypothetical protein